MASITTNQDVLKFLLKCKLNIEKQNETWSWHTNQLQNKLFKKLLTFSYFILIVSIESQMVLKNSLNRTVFKINFYLFWLLYAALMRITQFHLNNFKLISLIKKNNYFLIPGTKVIMLFNRNLILRKKILHTTNILEKNLIHINLYNY